MRARRRSSTPPRSPLGPRLLMPGLLFMLAGSSCEDGTVASSALGLPLIEASAPDGDTLVVFITGDGGWAPFARGITGHLRRGHLAVVALDSPRYLWKGRTPDQTAADVALVAREYLRRWHRSRLVLLGYSRGADIVPFVVARLPAELRDRLALVVLIGPARTTNFEFHPVDLVDEPRRPSDLPVEPELDHVDGRKVLCLEGEAEAESLCPEVTARDGQRVVLPGGHHFGGDTRRVSDVIVRRLGAAARP